MSRFNEDTAGGDRRLALYAVAALLAFGTLAGGIVLSTRTNIDTPPPAPGAVSDDVLLSSLDDHADVLGGEPGGEPVPSQELSEIGLPPSNIGRPASPTPPADAESMRAVSTGRMAARLAFLADNMDPNRDSYRASTQVAMMLQQGPPADDAARLQWESHLGVLYLAAGRPDEAVLRLEAVRAVFGGREAAATNNSARELTSALAASYLRLGEVVNCIGNHNAESCIFPIAGGGVHVDGEGSRSALQELEVLLAVKPDDLVNRWLLNLAHMTLGTWPDEVDEAFVIPPSVFASDVDIGRFTDVGPAAGVAVPGLSGGSIIEDFDGDGLLDILTSSWGLEDQLRYFRNEGDGTFSDRTAEAGLIGLTGGLNMLQADYDNDGSPDVLVLRGGWRFDEGRMPNSLLRNVDGRFEDVTEISGLWSEYPTQTAAWADFDGDGHLDLFIGNETQPDSTGSGAAAGSGIGVGGSAHPSELFRNNGDGTFTEVAQLVGVDVVGFVKAVVWGDINNNGYPDLFISRMLQPNILLRNDGPTGPDGAWAFTDITEEAGVAEPIASFTAWFWDYDNDGWLDIFVSGYGDPARFLQDTAADVAADYLGLPTNAARPRLYRNMGDGTFQDMSAAAGLDDVLHTMGANWGDFDNDGWPDAYIGTGEPDFRGLMPNRAYRNAGDGTFQDITTSAGLGHLQKGHGVSFGDIDNDGDQDIYHVLGGALEGDWYHNVLFQNPGHGNGWLTLRLEGRQANRAGIGARIRVDVDTPAGSRSIHHLVGSGGSFGANSLQAEIGLGDATAVRQVEIQWPGSGNIDRFADVAPNGFYDAVEGATELVKVDRPTFDLPKPHSAGSLDDDHGAAKGASDDE